MALFSHVDRIICRKWRASGKRKGNITWQLKLPKLIRTWVDIFLKTTISVWNRPCYLMLVTTKWTISSTWTGRKKLTTIENTNNNNNNRLIVVFPAYSTCWPWKFSLPDLELFSEFCWINCVKRCVEDRGGERSSFKKSAIVGVGESRKNNLINKYLKRKRHFQFDTLIRKYSGCTTGPPCMY